MRAGHSDDEVFLQVGVVDEVLEVRGEHLSSSACHSRVETLNSEGNVPLHVFAILFFAEEFFNFTGASFGPLIHNRYLVVQHLHQLRGVLTQVDLLDWMRLVVPAELLESALMLRKNKLEEEVENGVQFVVVLRICEGFELHHLEVIEPNLL